MFSVVLYTNNRINVPILTAVIESVMPQLSSPDQLTIVSHRRLDHYLLKGCPQIIYQPVGTWNADIYCQFRLGIEMAKYDTVFACEHDVLYPEGYYKAAMAEMNPDKVNYGTNIWFLNTKGFWTYRPSTFQSTCFGKKSVMLNALNLKERKLAANYSIAPPTFDLGSGEGELALWDNQREVLDIRHTTNASLTGTMDKQQAFIHELPFWGKDWPWIERLQLHHDHYMTAK